MTSILVVAHPGHELRIFHWMELSCPSVSILTDGSGGDKISRVDYSKSVLRASGASVGPVFGDMSDRDWYQAILSHDIRPFEGTVAAIAASAAEATSVTVVFDAVDGYNPLHDLAGAVGRAVACRLEEGGAKVSRMASAAVPGVEARIARELTLDDAACRRKLEAVRGYLPLAEEARRILDADPRSLARELLLEDEFSWPEDFQPHWEKLGAERVSSGRYDTPITYRDHVRPIARALLGL